MNDPLDRAIRAIARRNSFALMVAQFGAAHVVLLGGVTLLRLFQTMTARQFVVLVVVGLATRSDAHSVNSLGVDWVLAVVVSLTLTLTLSLELILLVVRTLGTSLSDMRRAVEAVRQVEGLGERETLRAAFGAYVDPGLAERVLREGADLAGEELDVSVLFLDVRDFTAFSEHAQPHEVVARLNELWELVVPALTRWHGQANKFIGDGLVGVGVNTWAPRRRTPEARPAGLAELQVAD